MVSGEGSVGGEWASEVLYVVHKEWAPVESVVVQVVEGEFGLYGGIWVLSTSLAEANSGWIARPVTAGRSMEYVKRGNIRDIMLEIDCMIVCSGKPKLERINCEFRQCRHRVKHLGHEIIIYTHI